MLMVLTVRSNAPAKEADVDFEPVERWLSSHRDVESAEIDFLQERYLRTLRNPLRSEGKMWLEKPDRFRWQTGSPPKTIAVGDSDQVSVLHPAKKKAEVMTLTGEDGSAPPSVGFIAQGFPNTVEEFDERFEILSVELKDGEYEIGAAPRDRKMAVALKKMTFFIDNQDYLLRGFELEFRDRSRVLTRFTRIVRGPALDPALFRPSLEGYEVEKVDAPSDVAP